MKFSQRNGKPKSNLQHRQRFLSHNHFYKHKETESDIEYEPPKEDGKVHVKWADDLEEVKTFKKLASDKRIQQIQENARNTTKVWGKSILKKKKVEYVHYNSDTEASSTGSEVEILHQKRRSQLRPKPQPSRKSVSVSRQVREKSKAVQHYPNSHYLEELLMARIKRKYNIPTAVSFY